ncbi:MAG: helix-turn-helix domain-containing protein [Candidatus Heimdallarchaeota archaeon]|nr:helix-turn-helix domain-containing protein [Candidatus Heimdallarchaeota archaeon]
MGSSKKESNLSDEKLDKILAVVKLNRDSISLLDKRISALEGCLQQSTKVSKPKVTTLVSNPQVDFDDKDKMLERAYTVLATEKRPMTTLEVAEEIGRSRSTTSQYLNELHSRNLLTKTQGKSRDKSRNIVFSLDLS